MDRMVYSTSTNGPGDSRAAEQHRKNVQRMMSAAMRRPCPKCSAMHSVDTDCKAGA